MSRTRALLVGAAALLGVALVVPLWITRMESPQYRGDEVLEVSVYAGRVEGDIHEIDLLNGYVGVHLPLDTAELHAAPWVLGSLLAVALLGAMVPRGARRRVAIALCTAMAVVLAAGTILLQYRLYAMGHERTKSAMTGVPDFTPPVVGAKKIANFTVHMSLGAGAWAYLAAMALVIWTARASRASSLLAAPAERVGQGGAAARRAQGLQE